MRDYKKSSFPARARWIRRSQAGTDICARRRDGTVEDNQSKAAMGESRYRWQSEIRLWCVVIGMCESDRFTALFVFSAHYPYEGAAVVMFRAISRTTLNEVFGAKFRDGRSNALTL